MEVFPATNDTAWELIKKVIEDSDYYVLVIGGRYGSMDESGISYTEKEYDFAVSQNIPVLAFLHSDPSSISIGKSETDSKIRRKLEAFKAKVKIHHCNFWKTTEELKEKVITSLSQSIVMMPQKGWVKVGGIDNAELLTRLADLQQKYDILVEENKKFKDSALFFDTDNFLQKDDFLEIRFTFAKENAQKIQLSLNQILFNIGEHLIIQCQIDDIKVFLEKFIFKCFKESIEYVAIIQTEPDKYKDYFKISIDSESFSEIEIQLQVLELITVSSIIKQSSGNDLSFSRQSTINTYIGKTWQLTDKGRKLYLSQKALRQK